MHCSFWNLLYPSPSVDIGISVEQGSKPVFIYLCVNVKLAQAVRTAIVCGRLC